ncbi:MAG TPA: ATP-grasp domain-containing protein [Pirellulales bacterium]|nr:ATP-grasp domain-containing protein [Pirellulales bacterium]
MQESLTIVGSSARAAARSAVRAGFFVRAGDLFADADLSQFAAATRVEDYPAGLGRVIGSGPKGAWMYTGALENHPALVERWALVRPLWGNPAAVLRSVRQPQLARAAFEQAGMPSPEVRFDPRDVPRDGTWLIKPRLSAGGMRVAVWSETQAHGGARGCYFQQYIAGMPCSAVYVAAQGRSILLGVTRQLTGQAWCGTGGFRYCGSVGPIHLAGDLVGRFARVGEVAAHAFNLVGLFGVDAVVNAAGVWPVEVNPRYTASVEILERAGMDPAIAAHRMACETARLPALSGARRQNMCGKAILFAPIRLSPARGWVERALQQALADPPLVADIPAAGTTIEAGWPIATVFADGPDADAVVSRLQAASREAMATIRG